MKPQVLTFFSGFTASVIIFCYSWTCFLLLTGSIRFLPSQKMKSQYQLWRDFLFHLWDNDERWKYAGLSCKLVQNTDFLPMWEQTFATLPVNLHLHCLYCRLLWREDVWNFSMRWFLVKSLKMKLVRNLYVSWLSRMQRSKISPFLILFQTHCRYYVAAKNLHLLYLISCMDQIYHYSTTDW